MAGSIYDRMMGTPQYDSNAGTSALNAAANAFQGMASTFHTMRQSIIDEEQKNLQREMEKQHHQEEMAYKDRSLAQDYKQHTERLDFEKLKHADDKALKERELDQQWKIANLRASGGGGRRRGGGDDDSVAVSGGGGVIRRLLQNKARIDQLPDSSSAQSKQPNAVQKTGGSTSSKPAVVPSGSTGAATETVQPSKTSSEEKPVSTEEPVFPTTKEAQTLISRTRSNPDSLFSVPLIQKPLLQPEELKIPVSSSAAVPPVEKSPDRLLREIRAGNVDPKQAVITRSSLLGLGDSVDQKRSELDREEAVKQDQFMKTHNLIDENADERTVRDARREFYSLPRQEQIRRVIDSDYGYDALENSVKTGTYSQQQKAEYDRIRPELPNLMRQADRDLSSVFPSSPTPEESLGVPDLKRAQWYSQYVKEDPNDPSNIGANLAAREFNEFKDLSDTRKLEELYQRKLDQSPEYQDLVERESRLLAGNRSLLGPNPDYAEARQAKETLETQLRQEAKDELAANFGITYDPVNKKRISTLNAKDREALREQARSIGISDYSGGSVIPEGNPNVAIPYAAGVENVTDADRLNYSGSNAIMTDGQMLKLSIQGQKHLSAINAAIENHTQYHGKGKAKTAETKNKDIAIEVADYVSNVLPYLSREEIRKAFDSFVAGARLASLEAENDPTGRSALEARMLNAAALGVRQMLSPGFVPRDKNYARRLRADIVTYAGYGTYVADDAEKAQAAIDAKTVKISKEQGLVVPGNISEDDVKKYTKNNLEKFDPILQSDVVNLMNDDSLFYAPIEYLNKHKDKNNKIDLRYRQYAATAHAEALGAVIEKFIGNKRKYVLAGNAPITEEGGYQRFVADLLDDSIDGNEVLRAYEKVFNSSIARLERQRKR